MVGKGKMQERLAAISKWWGSTVQAARLVGFDGGWRWPAINDQWALAVVLGLGGGFIGPFGTFFSMGFWERVLYWEAVILASFAVWQLLEWLLARLVGPQPYVIRRILIIPPFAVANSTAIVAIQSTLEALEIGRQSVSWPQLVISHLLLSSLVVLPSILVIRRMRGSVESKAGGEAIRFLTEKLPTRLRGEKPFALAAEGHYVRVHTAIGDDLVTMRFEDALDAVVGIEGVQTHRSWWVATDAIREVRRAGSAYEAVLASGLIVPVGRRRKSEVSQALRAKP